jgi:hypothetical protein
MDLVMLRTLTLIAIATGSLASATACARIATPAPGPTPAAPAQAGANDSAQAPSGQPGSQQTAQQGGRGSGPRPYRQVITSGAISQDGMFRTHMIDDRLYFEIPPEQLGREMLLVIRNMVEMGGGPTGFYRWERDGNRVRLWRQDYDVYADETSNLAPTVSAMARGPLIASFNVEAFGPDSAAVIEVTRLFVSNITEFGAIRGIVQDRSFVEGVTAFDDAINVVATQTGVAQPQGEGGGGGQAQPQASTQRMHWSFALLPEVPMMPRMHDTRVGFNSLSFIDYSRPEHATTRRRYILRHRLEKADSAAAVSDPIEPIVYYVDRATPEWLIPYVIAGVNQWRPAFESAGFTNAIEGRLAPSPEEDPKFSMFDARHSVIYWRATTTENASGGGIPDPRSGEILKGEVNMHHNVQNLLRNWYFTQVGPLDPRAHTLPLPDSLMGKLVEYVVAHEIGHSIGFPHNFKAAGMYPADSLRNEDFLRRMGGHVPTLMDYSRFNYIVQPEDDIPVELLIPQVGPYDRFALRWGYAPIPGANTPDDERHALDKLARMQDTIPWLRFATPGAGNDPTQLTEAVGNADAVNSSTLAIKNLDRVMDMMLAVAEKPGEDYALLSELYSNAVSQWGRYNGHVAAMIAGAESQEKLGTGTRFQPLSRERQKEAMAWLHENAFTTPQRFLRDEILFRIEPEGSVNRIRSAQASVLGTLLSESRINRLSEYEALNRESRESYTAADLMEDLRAGVWTELSSRSVRIDVYRRNLQRAHLHQIDLLLNPPRPPGQGTTAPPPPAMASDMRPVLRAELRELDRRAAAAMPRAADPMTRVHLEDVRMEIERILGI